MGRDPAPPFFLPTATAGQQSQIRNASAGEYAGAV